MRTTDGHLGCHLYLKKPMEADIDSSKLWKVDGYQGVSGRRSTYSYNQSIRTSSQGLEEVGMLW